MPYARYGTAISRYLMLCKEVAKVYGNPFRLADLPEVLEIRGKTYSRSSIKRYLSWIKTYYRLRGREMPVEMRYVPDPRRGKILEIYVDYDKVDKEIEVVREDTGRIPSPRQRRREIDRLRDLLRKTGKRLDKCREKLAECKKLVYRYAGRVEELEKTIEEMKRRIDELEKTREKLEKENRKLRKKMEKLGREYGDDKKWRELIARLLKMKPREITRCIEDINYGGAECVIVRTIIDRALVPDKDGVTGFDIAVTVVDNDYSKKVREQVRELKKGLGYK